MCQPKLMGTAVKSSAEASGVLEAFCRQPGVSLAPPDHDAWPGFHQLLRSADLPQRLCTDAYLAVLAMANGWRLVSVDRNCERFHGLQRLLLP
ncbi:hypothetical protein [Synechococcus sp. CBW1006]|uniref:hypothetical protein n=1 Tax=Synechococcus sp. CBW1006 TaxID=1353138 RepID=UPI001E382009|nr:hypothetical protein [Synechococcus sp. CBW1006]